LPRFGFNHFSGDNREEVQRRVAGHADAALLGINPFIDKRFQILLPEIARQ
jgi:hypothetical protein